MKRQVDHNNYSNVSPVPIQQHVSAMKVKKAQENITKKKLLPPEKIAARIEKYKNATQKLKESVRDQKHYNFPGAMIEKKNE